MPRKRVRSRPKKLLNLPRREFPLKARLLFGREVARRATPPDSGLELHVPVIQRPQHGAEDVEKLVTGGIPGHSRPVDLVLFVPVDLPQFEKRVCVVECPPQQFEISFRIARVHHGSRSSARVMSSEPAS